MKSRVPLRTCASGLWRATHQVLLVWCLGWVWWKGRLRETQGRVEMGSYLAPWSACSLAFVPLRSSIMLFFSAPKITSLFGFQLLPRGKRLWHLFFQTAHWALRCKYPIAGPNLTGPKCNSFSSIPIQVFLTRGSLFFLWLICDISGQFRMFIMSVFCSHTCALTLAQASSLSLVF